MIETNASEFRIEALAMRPDCIPALAALLHDEWGHLANWSDVEALIRELGNRAQTRMAPCALIALDGEGLAGSASIKVRELPHHDDKEFWVGDVIVRPDHRGRGLGHTLMGRIVALARELGIADLYLYTPDKERYYAKRGWQTIGTDPANGEDNVIMRLSNRG